MQSAQLIFLVLLVTSTVSSSLGGPSSSSHRDRKGSAKSISTEKSVGKGKTSFSSSADSIDYVQDKNETSSGTFWGGFTSESVQKVLGQVVTASSAVEHLEKMKNKLLSQFEKKTGEFATARGGYGGYGAYGFPSLEGALLSIAFLTFAVFLIDLIQQLLSRFRTGTAGVVPLVGRRRRSIVPEDDYDHLSSLTSNVLQSLERPTFGML